LARDERASPLAPGALPLGTTKSSSELAVLLALSQVLRFVDLGSKRTIDRADPGAVPLSRHQKREASGLVRGIGRRRGRRADFG
jgi:hypothetical protein